MSISGAEVSISICRYTMRQLVQKSGKILEARLIYLLEELELVELYRELVDILKRKTLISR